MDNRQGLLLPPPGWSPYSRAAWTEHQQRFRPPHDGPRVSTRLADYATRAEIDIVVVALKQVQRELGTRVRAAKQPATKHLSKAARDDVALSGHWAAGDRRRLGWILGDLRAGAIPLDYRHHVELLPEGPARDLLLQFYARYEAAQAAAIEELRQQWVPPPIGDEAWEAHLRGLALSGLRWPVRDWLLPHERRLSEAKRCRLIRERQRRYLDSHPERLQAVRRKVAEADGQEQR
jgi:hypothetical protein